ncbi:MULTISPECIES: SRPBCC domain-containing protein [Gordonia]|uniref:SRPBCC domain-containing protein n=1 Tax=Gordonia TaxID=2053 RepID=UPI0030FF1354
MPLVTDSSITINAPADVVWRVLTDFDAYGEWNPFQVECSSTLIPGAPIDMRFELGPGGLKRKREYIVDVTPGSTFAYSMKPAPLGTVRSLRRHTVVDLGDGRSRYDSHFEITGPVSGLVKLMFGKELIEKFAAVTAAIGPRAEALARG